VQPSAEIDRQAETRGSVSLITTSQYLLHKLRYAPLAMRRRRSAIKKNGSSYEYFRAMIHNRKLVIFFGHETQRRNHLGPRWAGHLVTHPSRRVGNRKGSEEWSNRRWSRARFRRSNLNTLNLPAFPPD
jgi:hypothetical protein